MIRKLFLSVFPILCIFSQPVLSSNSEPSFFRDRLHIPNSTTSLEISTQLNLTPLSLIDFSAMSAARVAEQYLENEKFFEVASASAMNAFKNYYQEVGLQKALTDPKLREEFLGLINFSKSLAELPEFFNKDFGIAAYSWRDVIASYFDTIDEKDKLVSLITTLFPSKASAPSEVMNMLREPVDFVGWVYSDYSKEKLIKNLDGFIESSDMYKNLVKKGYQVSVDSIKDNPSLLEEVGSSVVKPSSISIPKTSMLETVAQGVGRAVFYVGVEKLTSYSLKQLGVRESCADLASHITVSLPSLANPYLAAADLSLHLYLNREGVKDCAVSTYELASDLASKAYEPSVNFLNNGYKTMVGGVKDATDTVVEAVGTTYKAVRSTAVKAYEVAANQCESLRSDTVSFFASASGYLSKKVEEVGESVSEMKAGIAALYPTTAVYLSLFGGIKASNT